MASKAEYRFGTDHIPPYCHVHGMLEARCGCARMKEVVLAPSQVLAAKLIDEAVRERFTRVTAPTVEAKPNTVKLRMDW